MELDGFQAVAGREVGEDGRGVVAEAVLVEIEAKSIEGFCQGALACRSIRIENAATIRV